MKLRIDLDELKSPYYLEQTANYANQHLGIELKQQGGHYLANCPFHEDKTPSFYLYCKREKVRFKCFSTNCDEKFGWDIFALIQKIEGCNFITAVKRFGQHLSVDEVVLPNGNVLRVSGKR